MSFIKNAAMKIKHMSTDRERAVAKNLFHAYLSNCLTPSVKLVSYTVSIM